MVNNQKKGNENNNRMRIDMLLTLCEIIDDYDDYTNDINNLVEKYGSNVSYNLFRVINGDFVLFSDKYRKFISEHQHVIDTMKKYDTVWYFTGVLDYNSEKIDTYYDYLTNNRENIEFIKYNINKLRSLGLRSITLCEDKNFDDQVYVHKFSNDEEIVLLDNMRIASLCDSDGIFYTGIDSEYKIRITPECDSDDYDKAYIELNTLLFNSDKLPNDLSYKNAEKILKEIDPSYSIIQNLIEISSMIQSLADQTKMLNETISDMIDETTSKKEMISLLKTISINVNLLAKESEKYEETIIENNCFVTKEKMNKEKNKIFSKISCKND